MFCKLNLPLALLFLGLFYGCCFEGGYVEEGKEREEREERRWIPRSSRRMTETERTMTEIERTMTETERRMTATQRRMTATQQRMDQTEWVVEVASDRVMLAKSGPKERASIASASVQCGGLIQSPLISGGQRIGTVASYCGKYLGFLLEYERDSPVYLIKQNKGRLKNGRPAYFSSGEEIKRRKVSRHEMDEYATATEKFTEFWKSRKGSGAWWFPQREGAGIATNARDLNFRNFELIALDPDEAMETFRFRMRWKEESRITRGGTERKKFHQYFPEKGEVRLEQTGRGSAWSWNLLQESQ